MKHALLLAASLVLGVNAAQAQVMKLYEGQLCVLFNPQTVGDMEQTDGMLSIGGIKFNPASIDSIVFDKAAAYSATDVDVNYAADGKAYVALSDEVFRNCTLALNKAMVSFRASESLDEEITYILHGNSADGRFYMDGSYKAKLRLDGLTLTNTSDAAIQIDCGKRIDVEIVDGTVNTLADGAGGDQKACFFINGHAEFKGGGTLNIVGNAKHAYASDEYTWLKPSFGTLNITSAVSDGLHVQQYFRMDGGTVNVNGTKGDCIDVSATKDATDELNGQVVINAGTLSMDVAADDVKGLKSESAMTIAGGVITANVSGLGAKGISAGRDLVISQKTSTPTSVTMDVSGTTYHKDQDDESKCRGIKVKGNFTFDGGTINMNVTGKKAKGISVDGTYTYVSGTTNVLPE